MFEKASRMKLRFNTQRGVLSVEDLWDLPLIQLDNIATALNKKLQESKTESFIKTRTKDTTELELKIQYCKNTLLMLSCKNRKTVYLKVRRKLSVRRFLTLWLRNKTLNSKAKSLEELAKELEALN